VGTNRPNALKGLFLNQKLQLGKFWRAFHWKKLIYLVDIRNILQPFGKFYDQLIPFVFIWYNFPVWYHVPRKICQPCHKRPLKRFSPVVWCSRISNPKRRGLRTQRAVLSTTTRFSVRCREAGPEEGVRHGQLLPLPAHPGVARSALNQAALPGKRTHTSFVEWQKTVLSFRFQNPSVYVLKILSCV
jgi:hypothetical protein